MIFFTKYHLKKIILFFSFIILISCKLQEQSNNHGIIFLENRANKLIINNSNKNDVLKVIGEPHTKSIENENKWIYVERVLTKGEYHKLGQNILKSNNILILTFDKFGILTNKQLLDKNDLKNIDFSETQTENRITQKSFVEKLLQSLKGKMYGNR
tara:strand:- start:160 stop:627 length:468 start_codon:yes stop_codon:yes gene_type:complete